MFLNLLFKWILDWSRIEPFTQIGYVLSWENGGCEDIIQAIVEGCSPMSYFNVALHVTLI